MSQTLSLLTGEELTEHQRREARITVGKGVGYGVGMVGERMFRDAPALLLLVFMTNYLNIPAAFAGMAIFLPKLLLVFVDPLIGFYSDVSGSRAGRRRPFLVCGALLSGCAFVAMFNVPAIAATGLRTGYMIGLIGLCFAVYSVYSVPYLSFASDLSSDAYQRTRLLAYRMAFLAVGLNMSGSAGVLIEWFGGGIAGYEKMSYVYGLICLVTMLTPALTLRDPPIARRNPQNATFAKAARLVLSDVNYRRLLLVNFVQKMAEGVGYGSFAYFFLYWLHQPLSSIGACILASTVAQIVAQPLWVAASKRFSRTACCSASLGMYLIVNALWLTVPPQLFWPVPVLGFLAGVTVMGFLLMLVAMMTDVAVEKRETGDSRFEGMIGGMWLAIEKIGFAAGGALVALTLAAFGFVESNKGVGAPQSHTTLVGIAVAYVGLTTLFYALTLGLVLWVRKKQWKK
jgi:GPH family glycoside/pentoside/hexuronide:cation symporter